MARATRIQISLRQQVRRSCQRTLRRLFYTCITCALLSTLLILLAQR